MSAPHSFGSITVTTDRSSSLIDGSHSEITRCDQYPEVNREHEILEIVKDYPPEVAEEEHESRTCNFRIRGVRVWLLVVLICVVAIAVAIAVGLAIGIPASHRNFNMYVDP